MGNREGAAIDSGVVPSPASREAAAVNSQGREPLDDNRAFCVASPEGAPVASAAPLGLRPRFRFVSKGLRPWLLTAVPSGLGKLQIANCKLQIANCRRPPAPGPRPPCARGLTLVELLVVISIMVLLTAAVLRMMRFDTDGRRVREAARALNVYLGSARSHAIETGRPCGVMFRRLTAQNSELVASSRHDHRAVRGAAVVQR